MEIDKKLQHATNRKSVPGYQKVAETVMTFDLARPKRPFEIT